MKTYFDIRGMAAFTKALGEMHNVRVTVRRGPPQTDGKTVFIPPMMCLTTDDADAACGICAHEVVHAEYGTPQAMEDFINRIRPGVGDYYKWLRKSAYNVVCDVVDEEVASTEDFFGRLGTLFDATRHYCIRAALADNRLAPGGGRRIDQLLVAALWRTYSVHEWGDIRNQLAPTGREEAFLDEVSNALIHARHEVRDGVEYRGLTFTVASGLYSILRRHFPPPPKPDPPPPAPAEEPGGGDKSDPRPADSPGDSDQQQESDENQGGDKPQEGDGKGDDEQSKDGEDQPGDQGSKGDSKDQEPQNASEPTPGADDPSVSLANTRPPAGGAGSPTLLDELRRGVCEAFDPQKQDRPADARPKTLDEIDDFMLDTVRGRPLSATGCTNRGHFDDKLYHTLAPHFRRIVARLLEDDRADGLESGYSSGCKIVNIPRIFADGKVFARRCAEAERAAVAVCIDISGSMGDKRYSHGSRLSEVAAIAKAFVEGMSYGTDFRVIVYSDNVYVIDTSQLKDLLPLGNTSTGAAMSDALDWLESQLPDRKILVVLTDGRAGDPGLVEDSCRRANKLRIPVLVFEVSNTDWIAESMPGAIVVPASTPGAIVDRLERVAKHLLRR